MPVFRHFDNRHMTEFVRGKGHLSWPFTILFCHRDRYHYSVIIMDAMWPVNSPHKWPATRKMFPFDDVIMTVNFIATKVKTPPLSLKYKHGCLTPSWEWVAAGTSRPLLQWSHNERDGVSTGVSIVCSTVCWGADKKKQHKLSVTDLCAGKSPVTGDFPAQMASNAENVSIWWRHHGPIWAEVTCYIGNNADIHSLSIFRQSTIWIATWQKLGMNTSKPKAYRAPSRYPKRRLSVRSRQVSEPRDLYLELSDRSEIWQALPQQCCRCACQISKRYDNSKYQSRGFETLRDLTKRRLFGYWDGAQAVISMQWRDLWKYGQQGHPGVPWSSPYLVCPR